MHVLFMVFKCREHYMYNSLPARVVMATYINQFKKEFDNHFKTSPQKYQFVNPYNDGGFFVCLFVVFFSYFVLSLFSSGYRGPSACLHQVSLLENTCH